MDRLYLKISVLWGLAGLLLGISMAISGDHSYFPLHAHINLLGWVSFALFGLIYRAVPAALQDPLAKWQFIIANLGAVLFFPGIYTQIAGHEALKFLVMSGSVLTVLGFALFALILLRRV